QIGQAEQERLLNIYEQESSKLYNFVYRLNRVSGLDKMRRMMIMAVSDIMVYESKYWSDQIRNTLLDKINPYVNTGDSVSIIAHSLGSVITFDTLYYNTRNNPDWLAANFKPTNLFTLGSP